MMSAQLELPSNEVVIKNDIEEQKMDPGKDSGVSTAPAAKKRKSIEEEEDSGEVKTVFELSAKRRVSVEEFKGQLLVSIREYYEDKNDGQMKPTKKGLSLTVEQWEQLKAVMPGVDRAISSMAAGKKK